MFKNIPIQTMEEDRLDHEQLIAIINRLGNERDTLWRENEYLKAKLNESVLIETINDIRKERDLLLKLLLNLSANQKDEQQKSTHFSEEHLNDLLPPPPYQTYSATPNGQHVSSPSTKKPSNYSRHHHHPPARDLSIPVTELKPSRRSHRTSKANVEPSHPTVVYRVEGTKECLMNPDELSSVFAHVKHSHPNKKIVVFKTSTTPQTHEFNQLMDEMCVKHGVELKHSHNSPFQQYRSQSLQDLTKPQPRDFDFQFQTIEKQEQKRIHLTKK